ncbi:MAG: YegS/Rv2252/BmrU family lipid kinase [Alistipes sp.]|nr:YegS/Rv2252/BmrU family lipid kinase [Alistipes sp.]
MRALLLYNVMSGRGSIEHRIEDIAREFECRGITLSVRRVDFGCNPFDGAESVDMVVVCGGDGTVNFVVNSMQHRGLDVMLGIIPSGTANDLAGALNMPSDVVLAARKIAEGSERRVDCGVVNGKRFVNVLSFGVLTTTSQHTPDEAKRRFGKMAYLWVGMRDLVKMHPMRLRITANGKSITSDSLMCLVFNGETAGRFRIARGAKLDDGRLDVLLLERRNMMMACGSMIRYLLGGHPDAVRSFTAQELRIETLHDEPTDIDGQEGPRFPLHVTCEHRSLRVRC